MGAKSELEKTKLMRVARKSEKCEVKTRNDIIQQIDAMKYLVVIISSDDSMEKKAEARIVSTTRTFGGMNEIVLESVRIYVLRRDMTEVRGSLQCI